jgi:hypothetical protein
LYVNTSVVGNVYFGDTNYDQNISWGSSSNGSSTYIFATAGGGSGGVGGGLGAFTLGGNVVGSSTASGNTVQLYGGNNITLSGYSGSRIRIDGPTGYLSFSDGSANNFSFGTTNSGNTTIVSGSFVPAYMSFSDGGGITWSTSNNNSTTIIRASVNAGTGGTYAGGGNWTVSTKTGSNIAISTGVTNTLYQGLYSVPQGSVYYQDGGGVSFGAVSAGLSTTITAAVDAIKGGGNLSFSAGSSTATLDNLVFSNSNGISFGLNGSTITAQHNGLVTAAASDHTHNDLYQSTGAYLTTYTVPSGSISFVNGGGVSWGTQTSGSTNVTAVTATIVTGGGGGGNWATSAIAGSGISILTGAATNTLQYGAFLTTIVAHTHDYQSTGAYLVTAAQSDHSHTNNIGLGSTGITGGSATVNSTALLLNIPVGSMYFGEGSGVSWGSAGSGSSTSMYASIVTSYLSASLMPLGYSSAFQTDALSTKFLTVQTVPTNFVGLGSTAITGGNATINSTGLLINIPQNSLYYSDGSGLVWGLSTSGSSTSVYGSILTSYLSGSLMPLSYSSGFQTATLATVLLPLANSTQWATGTLSSALMPLSYSSGFNTSVLSTKFLTTQTVPTAFAGIASTGVTGGSGTINSSQILLNIPAGGTIYFQDSNGHSFSSSTAAGATTVYIVT